MSVPSLIGFIFSTLAVTIALTGLLSSVLRSIEGFVLDLDTRISHRLEAIENLQKETNNRLIHIMSAITDSVTATETTLASISAGVTQLSTDITNLAGQLANAGLSDADKAALADLQAKATALNTQTQAAVAAAAPPAPPAAA